MDDGRFNDEIWDEHQWEAYLNEIEQKSNQLRKFIASDKDESYPRWLTLLQENPDILDAVDAFIEEELQIEDAYFPDDEDEDDWEDEEFDDFLWDTFDEEADDDDPGLSPFGDDEDDFDFGEDWKELSEDYSTSDNGSIENLVIYNRARDFSARILQWAESVHPRYHTVAFSDFVSSTLKIGAKLAGGYSFGFERDYLGGNIACTKRALYAANEALRLLADDIKGTPLIATSQYMQMHELLFELRNDIGIYVQELRAQFNLGLE